MANKRNEVQKIPALPILETNSDYAVMERKKWVLDQYLSGRLPYEVKAEYIVKYNLSEHSCEQDVVWVNQQLRRKGMNDIEEIIEHHTDLYRHVFRLAVDKQDYRSAINALRNIEDLFKIHKPMNASIRVSTTNNYDFTNLSFDQLKELASGQSHTDIIELPASD